MYRGVRVVLPSVWSVWLGGAVLVMATGCGSGEGASANATPEADAATRAAVSGAEQDTAGGTAVVPVQGGGQASRIRVAGIPVTAEIADDQASRERGLMFRESLPPDHGMLFVYESERVLGFWMKNTHIPLDIAFIDRTGRIVDIQQMEAMTETTHSSRAPAMYALEMALGWFAEHGVGVGDRVEF
ncbi:MAG: DUF192 domain-containing protein [Gemmatimonadota bacterium]